MPYSGFGMMSRTVVTITVSRAIRTVAFLLTVLPNPRPGCYLRRFPVPAPDTWRGFFATGFARRAPRRARAPRREWRRPCVRLTAVALPRTPAAAGYAAAAAATTWC